MVDDLSTDHFIVALKRFIVRRGRPQNIYSDNGTNFVGANNELQQCIGKLNEERIQDFCAPKEIKWNFNLPSAPHLGGRLGETSPMYEENAEGNIGKQGRFQRSAENCFS